VPDGASSSGFFPSSPEADREERRFGRAFASSAVLHTLALILVLLPLSRGVQGSHGTLELVPVEIEVPSGRSQATEPFSPASSAATGTETADKLEKKLEALADLRQPDSDHPIAQQNPAEWMPLMSADAAPGRVAALRDFIRDQVERHWSLDLASLGNNEFSIPIRIQITNSGTVLKAEIIDTARASDPVYQEIASSARNAVLSASPLSLPAGHYQTVTELVLYLNPRATLR
jgi:hypothetical protein